LPQYPEYELKADRGSILIGPCIGLLMSRSDKSLTSKRLEKLTVYAREYASLHGAVVVFALDKVDTAERLVHGYCYDPSSRRFEKGTFPYPSAIYRTVGLSRKWRNHFLSALGDRIFNGHYFNKWDLYRWLSKDPSVAPHLPETMRYASAGATLDAAQHLGKVFIKPVSGLGGRRIARLSWQGDAFMLEYREDCGNRLLTFESRADAADALQKRFSAGKFLIQQGVELLDYQGGIFDFRCIMQKDQTGRWVCKSIIGRRGRKGSIVSNITSGGHAFSIEDLTPAAAALDLPVRIEALALKVCQALDSCGIHCGILGVDIGADTQGRLWLFEANNRDPDPSIALDIHEVKVYYALKTGPLFYAKALAGFREEPKKEE
ncbi:MAG: YheC/YheD family protein, partial [Clostridia bacterium]|nr:YheC/YheD family protein [Clostridia bacterium]